MKPSILIADDEPNQLELMAYNLKKADFVIHQAENGEEALEKVEELKLKNLWDKDSFASSFATSITINPKELDFGVNVYAVGAAVDGRKKKPPNEILCELTTTHTVSGGWGCYNFLVEGKNFGIFHLQWVPMEVTNFHGRPGPVGEVS